ncbi:DNA primase [Halodesulfovibrio marinisediminis DSM 17456]|uniref:DNA primase n=2 Tax=Halodesulfovibrio marinisediminis TaxID=458711 RepID=A0A1N6DYL6_9BACT|nr:DNA primase [Halodesulfovibrio marinisediminis DSM 17456]
MSSGYRNDSGSVMTNSGFSAVKEIKARLNIADVARRYMELRHAGGRWMGLCPFHQEKTPSFSINEEEGFYYCFGCQAAGDVIDFYCKVNGLEFRDGLQQLAEETGVQLTEYKADPRAKEERDFRKQCYTMYDIAKNHFRQNLSKHDARECRTYIKGRKLTPEIVESFELGWAPDSWQSLSDALVARGMTQKQAAEAGLLSRNDRGRMYDRFRGRLIFPIKNLSGQVIAFGGRIIGKSDQAKYINSSDSAIYKKGEHLYGLFQARRAISAAKSAFLTEGYMDVLTLHQFGFENSCGVLGTALTPDQVKRLGGFCSSVDLIFDGDEAGRKAALKSCEMILTKGMKCRVVLLPDGEDIDSFLHERGVEAFQELLAQSPDGLSYCTATVSMYAPRDVMDWTTRFLSSMEKPELCSFYVSRIASGLGLDETELRQLVAPKRNVQTRSGTSFPQRGARNKSDGWKRNQDAQGTAPRPVLAASLEERVLQFIVRYPHHVFSLEQYGGMELLQSAWAESLWNKISAYGNDAAEYLEGKEKVFWIKHRVVDTVAMQKEQEELNDVCMFLERTRRQQQGQSLVAAMRHITEGGEQDAEMDFLLALKESLGRSNGEY